MAQQLDCPSPVAHQRVMIAIQEILDIAQCGCRAVERLPYYGPVSVALEIPNSASLSAFAREVSEGGIGLIHVMPLKEVEVVIRLPLPSGRLAALRTQIVWCRDYGNGWHASGGRFLDVV
jgi:hypothetical protein